MVFAILGDALHLALDLRGLTLAAFKNRVGENVIVGNGAMTVGKAHSGVIKDMDRAAAPARIRVLLTGAASLRPRARRMTTPGMPPSRANRFEPTPITITGKSS